MQCLLQVKLFLFIFLEPVGSVGPRLLTGNDIKVLIASINSIITLLCPAQAYPVPFFR